MTDQPPQEGDLILYRTANDAVRVEVLYESETFWLDQKRIAELFGVEIPTIRYHLKEIYASGELTRDPTLRKLLRVQREGNREVRREIEFYNLDAIISVGYRVNSAQATQFRIWATQTLREFIVKGFVLDDERLKLNKRFGKDYFDELLEPRGPVKFPRVATEPQLNPVYAAVLAHYGVVADRWTSPVSCGTGASLRKPAGPAITRPAAASVRQRGRPPRAPRPSAPLPESALVSRTAPASSDSP